MLLYGFHILYLFIPQSGAANTSTKPIKSSGVIKPAIPLPSKGSPITNKKPLLPPPRVIIRPRPSAYEELDINGLLPATTYELTTIVKTPENYVSGSSSPGIRKRNVADNKASVPLVAVAKTTGDTEDTHLSQQIKFIQEKMQEMEKQIGKFLKKQSHLEDEINVLKLSGRQQKGNQSPLVIHRGMSPTQVCYNVVNREHMSFILDKYHTSQLFQVLQLLRISYLNISRIKNSRIIGSLEWDFFRKGTSSIK